MKDRFVYLDENEFPKMFYNALPDLPEPIPPYLDKETGSPIDGKKLEMLFPKKLVSEELSGDRFHPIPKDLRDLYLQVLSRPRPLVRAYGLEKALALGDDVRIYYKREDLSPTGSHKPNTALAQLYYAYKEGSDFVTTETGAGQWGSAVAFCSEIFDIRAEIYMVRVSYDQKPLRKAMMSMVGADVLPSPSERTNSGRAYLKKGLKDGSLGIAISEAIESAVSKGGNYVLGSVLNSVLMHQTIIGEETLKQLEMVDEVPTDVIGCFGGGSNLGGIALPFYREYIKSGKSEVNLIAAEPSEVPSLSRGKYTYDHGDSFGLTPMIKMFSLGKDFMPPPIYAGGLRYHGSSPLISVLKKHGIVNPKTYGESEARDAGRLFFRTEGIVPAPESAHAIACAIERAKEAKKFGKDATIVFSLSGHGIMDIEFYA